MVNRLLAAVGIAALVSIGASAATPPCPTPSQPLFLVIKVGPSSVEMVGQEVVFNVGSAFFPAPYTLTDCDIATWDFHDGPKVTAPAKDTVRHTFNKPAYTTVDVVVSNGAGQFATTTQVTIGSNPLTLARALAASVAENAGFVDVALQRSGNLTTTATVSYTSGPLPNGSFDRNLESLSGSVVFAPGETQKTVRLRVQDDNVYGGDSAHTFRLTALDGTYISALGDPHTGTVTITVRDDETPPVATVSGETRIIEGNSGQHLAHFDVTFSPAPAAGSLMTYTIADVSARAGSDFVRNSATIAITGTHAGFDVPIIGDTEPESNETFNILLSSPVATFTTSTLVCTIVNDDTGFLPNSVHDAAGATPALHLETGLPRTSAASITFTSDTPGVAAPPPPATLAAGATSIDVKASALHGGQAVITAHFSDRNDAPSATVVVFEPTTLVFRPATLLMPTQVDVGVELSLLPPRTVPVTVTVDSSDPKVAAVKTSPLVIPAGGSANVVLRGTFDGTALVTARLNTATDSVANALLVTVTYRYPHIDGVTPRIAPPEGGARVTVAGYYLESCTGVKFGDLDATDPILGSAGLSVRTPPHPVGVVDVIVTCAGQQFVLPNAFQFAHGKRRAL